MLTPIVCEQLLRTEIGYAGATALLALCLAVVYRQGPRRLPAPGRPGGAQPSRSDRAIAR